MKLKLSMMFSLNQLSLSLLFSNSSCTFLPCKSRTDMLRLFLYNFLKFSFINWTKWFLNLTPYNTLQYRLALVRTSYSVSRTVRNQSIDVATPGIRKYRASSMELIKLIRNRGARAEEKPISWKYSLARARCSPWDSKKFAERKPPTPRGDFSEQSQQLTALKGGGI